MAISISERRLGDITVLEVRGRIVFDEDALELRDRINSLIDQGRLKLLLDLHDVTYLDSFGVGVIASKYVSVRRKGGNLKILCPSPRSREVLGTAGLMKIFESFESEGEALGSFRPAAGK